MARRRSFTAKSNRGKAGLVLMNNIAASYQKQKKQEAKSAAAASRSRAREAERERARRSREAERAQIRAEREAERKRKERARLDAKETAVSERLKLEFPKVGLYPGTSIIADIATRAVKASVTPAKARSFFVDGKESELAEACAIDYLVDQKIPYEYHHIKEFTLLKRLVTDCRPQTDAKNGSEYQNLRKTIDKKIEQLVAKAKREEERNDLIKFLIKEKSMFKDEIEEFAELIEKKDWDKVKASSSAEYSERIKNKSDYVAEIKSQILPIKLSRSTNL